MGNRGSESTITQQHPDQQEYRENHALAALEHPLLAGSIYSDEERRLLGPWQKVRQRLPSPIALVLSQLGISAKMLLHTSVFFGLGFCLLAPFHFEVAFWLLVASVVCDGLDDVEARLTLSG